MNSSGGVAASVDIDVFDDAAEYNVRRYEDDPNADLRLSITVGSQGHVGIEMTDAQAGQLAVDLLEQAVGCE